MGAALGGGAFAIGFAVYFRHRWIRRALRAARAEAAAALSAADVEGPPGPSWSQLWGRSRSYSGVAAMTVDLTGATLGGAGTRAIHPHPSPVAGLGRGVRTIDFSELGMGELIGSGGFGSVYKARWRDEAGEERAVAVKVLGEGAESGGFEREVLLLSTLEHRHIVRLLGVARVPGQAAGRASCACLVQELVSGGSLQDFLYGAPGRRCTYLETLHVASDVVSAMVYLHARGVVHRDLKPANVLLDSSLRARICDFGISRERHGWTYVSTQNNAAGTPAYLAPELFGHGRISAAVDAYALGVTLTEMASGVHPWAHLSSPVQIMYAVAVLRTRVRKPRRLRSVARSPAPPARAAGGVACRTQELDRAALGARACPAAPDDGCRRGAACFGGGGCGPPTLLALQPLRQTTPNAVAVPGKTSAPLWVSA